MEIKTQGTLWTYYSWHTGYKRRHEVVFLPPFTLIRYDGTTRVVYDLCEINVRIGDFRTWVHYPPSYKDGYPYRTHSITYINEYICRDDRGQIVTDDDVAKAKAAKAGPGSYYKKYRLPIIRAMELGLPIPRTGVRRWHRPRLPAYMRFKRMANAAENDMRDEEICDYKIKGKVRVPPVDPYDDFERASGYDRSWKRFRKTQWK